jgi:Leucine-rich repeat (LRR) protein
MRVLVLNRNNITKVPDIEGYWPDKTKTISLSFNNIKNLPNNWPPNLSGLYLIGNQIEQINCYFPKKLSVLNLSNNFISNLPNDINYWPPELMYLDISHNSIQSLSVNYKKCRTW